MAKARQTATRKCDAAGMLGPRCISDAATVLTLVCECGHPREEALCTGHATRLRQTAARGQALCSECATQGRHACRQRVVGETAA